MLIKYTEIITFSFTFNIINFLLWLHLKSLAVEHFEHIEQARLSQTIAIEFDPHRVTFVMASFQKRLIYRN